METAKPIVARFHPNSASNECVRIPGSDRTAAAVKSVTNMTPSTTHA
jgi:hypothetical protein